MALWQGSAFNTTESAMVINKVANRKAIAMIQKQNALLYKLVGKPEDNSVNPAVTKFERSKDIAFKNYEVRLLGSLTGTSKVADGAGETATATKQFDAAQWGSAEFALTHYTHTQSIPSSQLLRYKGDNAKTASFIDEQLEAVMLSYENDMGNDLHSTSGGTAIGRTVFGSWCFAVSDGTSTGETGDAFKLYGTIDRSDAANVDFRGLMDTSSGPVSLQNLRTNKNLIAGNLGKADVLIAGQSLFSKLEGLVEAYTVVTNAPDMVNFGGEYFRYMGMDFMLDARCPAGTIGLLDSSTWEFIRYASDFTSSGIIVDPGAKAAHCLITEMWAQLVCKQPNRNLKMTNKT